MPTRDLIGRVWNKQDQQLKFVNQIQFYHSTYKVITQNDTYKLENSLSERISQQNTEEAKPMKVTEKILLSVEKGNLELKSRFLW